MTIEELLEIEEIKNLRHYYALYLDSGEIEKMVALFVEDGVAEWPEHMGGYWTGHKQMLENWTKVYKQAGITNPFRQFDVAELQEPYTCFELSYYESLGFCPEGGAAELIKSGATEMTGELPVNPSGGCMGANPIGATALIRLAEAAMQVTGKAGEHQIPDAQLALAQAGGGWANLRGVAVVGSEKR